MAYTRFYLTWHNYPDTTTPVTAPFFQALEDFLVTVTPGIAPPSSPSANDALVYNGTAWTNAKLVNANVDAAAAIAYSKLNLAGSITGSDIAAGAAIPYSKLNLAASIVSADIVDGTIVNADVGSAAAIARSKLDFGSGLVNADVASAAAIAYSKLSLAGSIVNADISSSAAIALSKLAGYPSDATKFARGDGTWAVPAGGTTITGSVTSAGVKSLGSGFTVARNSAGNYTVTFTVAFASQPIVIPVANQNSGANPSAFIANPGTGSVQIITTVGGTATDTPFMFSAFLIV